MTETTALEENPVVCRAVLPGAHRHPETLPRMRRQGFDYGAGLGAMLGKPLLTGPNRWTILSRAPQGLRYYTDPKSRKNAMRDTTFPRSLNRLERTGLLYGPIAYLASRLTTPQ